ncbi:MAG: ATP-dependent sacrificial sulfur transferase LarE [Myxococcaceae bacterium]|nr:ATP-dependent sacrificial sulfur transferase LarE [Myxococcaceae bacterium]
MLTDAQVDVLCAGSAQKLEALRASLRAHPSALVAFSGGVDSAFVLKVALEVLGERAIALTALSPSVAPDEAAEAKALAESLGARHVLVESKELEDPRYAANPTNRCYFCKTELYTICEAQRAKLGLDVVLDGFNADDKKDHRPGHQAARENRVSSPLAAAGLTKDEIRAWSKRLGLVTWNKPQMACLASRLPYGTKVTVERLNQVGRAEKALRALGLSIFRVRHHGDVARLEVGADELGRLHDAVFRSEVDKAVKACGYTFVAVDLEPFRTGRLNDAITPQPGLGLNVLPS